jgi:hypothetical protein
LFVHLREACVVALFERSAAFGFEGLHPEGFGDVSDGFR